MKVTKSLKMLIAMFVMVVGFMITGITTEAATVTNLKQTEANESGISISWTGIPGDYCYGVQIATDPSFNNIIPISCNYVFRESFLNYELASGSTYYVRVSYGKYPSDYLNPNHFCKPITVVTAPKSVENIKFTNADDNTATISWDAVPGADTYKIENDKNIYYTNATSFAVPLVNGGSNEAKVTAIKTDSTSGFKAESIGKKIYNLSKLTTKVSTSNFGLTSVLSNYNSNVFDINAYGTGWEVEARTTKGKAYKVLQTGSITSYGAIRISVNKKMKQNKMYKYRVRAFITTTDGQKVYGNWSNYRYMISPKGKDIDCYTKYRSNKIYLDWKKVTGVSKIKVQISKRKKSGYKTCATLSGSKKSYTISKYGKSKLKPGKTYYVRLIYQYKSGKKTYNSDFYPYWQVRVR